jgi:teichuronic acid exporter
MMLKEGTRDLREIFKRIKKRDFSGNSGKAIKNSLFSFSATLVAKVGSIFFTIILARLLLPELFGLYALSLSTILIFSNLSNLGISQTLVKFLSSSKNPKKSKSYFSYLVKIKLVLSLTFSTILILSARFIANTYYNKPIFLALVAGSLYILISGFIGLFEGMFQSKNNFKKTFYKETLFQISRIVLVLLGVFLTISHVSTEVLLFIIFIALSLSFLFTLIFIAISAKKEISFLKLKSETLDKKAKKRINKFIVALSAMTLSGIFFGFIDMVILGRYVGSEFIGFYRAAFALITSAAPLINFSGALFPLFSRLKGKQLKRGLNKSVKITISVAIPVLIITLIFAPLIIRIIYGTEYLFATNILRFLSALILILPLIAVYSSFLISQNQPKKVAQSLIIATIINVILNYIFIFSLLPYGNLAAVYGAIIATIISKIIYLGILVFRK